MCSRLWSRDGSGCIKGKCCGFAVAGSTWLIISSVGYLQGNWRHTHSKYESLIPTLCISPSVSTQFPPSVSRVSSGIRFTHQMAQLVRPKELLHGVQPITTVSTVDDCERLSV